MSNPIGSIRRTDTKLRSLLNEMACDFFVHLQAVEEVGSEAFRIAIP